MRPVSAPFPNWVPSLSSIWMVLCQTKPAAVVGFLYIEEIILQIVAQNFTVKNMTNFSSISNKNEKWPAFNTIFRPVHNLKAYGRITCLMETRTLY